MANYTVDKIKYGSNVYILKDGNALPLAGGSVTGPVIFGDAVTADSISTGDLVVTGAASFANNLQAVTINGVTVGSSPKFTDTTYSSLAAASGGTAVSLVTTGEKYTWNNKSNLTIGTTATTAAAGNHTHTTSIATSSGTNQVTLAASTKYAITAGGTSYVFTTPPNTTYSSLAAASGGTDVSLVTTGEKYTWNSKTSNTGTVTKVTAGAGLSGGDITTTGTIAHSNSVTAQTTQAIYPIKIDAQGHISAYGTAVTPLTSHQTIKQDAVTGATGNHYASCTTAAGTAAKTASITAGTPSLEAGLRVSVKFSNANTAGTPTLNINSLGAKNIFHKGAQITTGSNKALLAGLVDFIYDGTQWHLVGNYLDTNTTYTASTTSIGSASAGTAISADDITAWTTNTPTAVTKKTVVTSASGATAAVSNGVLTLTNGSFGTGDSVTVTAGTAASLSYTSRSIPNISVTSTTVATGITAN